MVDLVCDGPKDDLQYHRCFKQLATSYILKLRVRSAVFQVCTAMASSLLPQWQANSLSLGLDK